MVQVCSTALLRRRANAKAAAAVRDRVNDGRRNRGCRLRSIMAHEAVNEAAKPAT
jgi:hypothetical protein